MHAYFHFNSVITIVKLVNLSTYDNLVYHCVSNINQDCNNIYTNLHYYLLGYVL